MVKYLMHCTNPTYAKKILTEKVIKTAQHMHQPGTGERDLVYFSFFRPKESINEDIRIMKKTGLPMKDNICFFFKTVDLLRKYKFYFISIYWDYGRQIHKISSALYNLVQKSTSIEDFRDRINNNKKMTLQCKLALLDDERIDQFWRYKNHYNPTIIEFIDDNPVYEWFEICFFENIDFSDLEFKVVNKLDDPMYNKFYQLFKK